MSSLSQEQIPRQTTSQPNKVQLHRPAGDKPPKETTPGTTIPTILPDHKGHSTEEEEEAEETEVRDKETENTTNKVQQQSK